MTIVSISIRETFLFFLTKTKLILHHLYTYTTDWEVYSFLLYCGIFIVIYESKAF